MRRPHRAISWPSCQCLRVPCDDACQPLVDHRLFIGIAAAAHPQPLEAGQHAQREHAADAVRAHLQRQGPGLLALAHARAVPAHQPGGQRRGQQRGEFRNAGLEVVVDLEQVVLAGLDFALDPLPASGPALEVRDPHDVVEGHPQRQPACHFTRGGEIAHARRVGGAFGLQHLLQALQVEIRVSRALVLQHAGVAEGQHVVDLRRELLYGCHCGLDPQSIFARQRGCRIKSGMTAALATMSKPVANPRKLASADLPPPARTTCS